MKILELNIENIRGIKSNIPIIPNGENVVIHGRNGTGKSGVVDSLDFLLTGNISRLTGEGTQGISLKEHGKHIDADIKEAVVTAKVQIEGLNDPVTLTRNMHQSGKLIVEPKESKEAIKETLEIANRGQHVLSRAKILEFIAAKSNDRASMIQTVLNLSEIEELRKNIGAINNSAGKEVTNCRHSLDGDKSAILPIIGIEKFLMKDILQKVNVHRKILGGDPIKELRPHLLRSGVQPQTEKEESKYSPEKIKKNIDIAIKVINEQGNSIYEKEKKLRQTSQNLKADEMLRRSLASKRLVDLGISLIDDSGICPLCLTPWDSDKLKTLLESRLEKAGEAAKLENNIKTISSEINSQVITVKEFIKTFQDVAEKIGEEEFQNIFDDWCQCLDKWSEGLKKATDDYRPVDEISDEIKAFLAPKGYKESFEAFKGKLGDDKKITPEQQAWDTLTQLEPALKRYLDDKDKFDKADRYFNITYTLDSVYNKTKDKVLKELYDSVNNDFTTYYKELHGEDEKGFSSKLVSEGAKLDFEVNFYGRGNHHPKALHSEGHQDSMGLCLYLALNKKISEGKVKLIILDDVVMSIDDKHRRNVCKLINKHFSSNQFFITTHDRTWARQLKTDGVVKGQNNSIHFKGWNVTTGPKFANDSDIWKKINKHMDDDEIPSAAHLLRENGEFFYENVCDSLRGNICYRSDAGYGFGDYLSGAKGALSSCLKKAKRSAQSWDKEDLFKEFEVTETQTKAIFERIQFEQWGINASVHYNNWATLGKEDFMPIVEAFQDLESLYICSECNSVISLEMDGMTAKSVKCPCGKVSWNLEAKKN